MLVFGILASLVFAFINRSGARERTKYIFYLLAMFVILSIVAAWIMYFFPL
jgi:hypothetical protein